MDNGTLFQHIENSREAIIRDCIKLINIPSVSHRTEDVDKCLKTFLLMAEDYGFYTYMTPEKDVGIIEMGQGEETIGILVHVDVVDEGDIEKWITKPFEGIFDGEYILGRGAEDNKGPAVVALHAMKIMKDLNIPLKKKIQLIVGTQEEVLWTDMDHFKQHFKTPDFGFTPDGGFPIENREKGYADILLTFSSMEDCGYEIKIKSLNSGGSVNSIPSHAEAEIEISSKVRKEEFIKHSKNKNIKIIELENNLLKISADGVTVHSSEPEKGVNAINLICDFLGSYFISPGHAKQAIGFVNEYMRNDYYGKKLGLYQGDSYLNGDYMGFTTIAPTIMKVQEETFLNLNTRTKYGTTMENLYESVFKHKDEFDYSIKVRGYLDPLYVDKEKNFIKAMSNVYEEVSGFKNEFRLAYGTSYAKAMPNMVCFGPVFPDQQDFAHQENERISIQTLLTAAKIYTLFLVKISVLDQICGQ